MKVSEVASLIETEHPELLRPGGFRPPTNRCTEWIVVRRPPADRRFYEATIKAPTQVVATWAARQANNSWSSTGAHRAALEFMVSWLAEADLTDDSLTLPNRDMMAVLEPYAETFMRNGQCRVWCPKCGYDFLQDQIKQSLHKVENKGHPPSERHQWLCERRHLIYDREVANIVF